MKSEAISTPLLAQNERNECQGQESNLHALKEHWILNPACLPVPAPWLKILCFIKTPYSCVTGVDPKTSFSSRFSPAAGGIHCARVNPARLPVPPPRQNNYSEKFKPIQINGPKKSLDLSPLAY